MANSESSGVKRISAKLPIPLVNGLDELKKEWGLRARGAVLERLLEELFSYEKKDDITREDYSEISKDKISTLSQPEEQINYSDEYAIILTGTNSIELKETKSDKSDYVHKKKLENVPSNTGINLPGFVKSRTNNLKRSLNKNPIITPQVDSHIYPVKELEIKVALTSAIDHWNSLYGNKPGENVIEAAMIWLARDIWPHVEGSENITFTWNAASKLMAQYCPSYKIKEPSFETIIVTAGVLEDPFASNNLKDRIPTIIRRFVNRFKRSNNVTSFQTIESTMTVHGALRILGLPTQTGSKLTLSSIREAYKTRALESHPDSGGSTEKMRKINEGYQLLKGLYKK